MKFKIEHKILAILTVIFVIMVILAINYKPSKTKVADKSNNKEVKTNITNKNTKKEENSISSNEKHEDNRKEVNARLKKDIENYLNDQKVDKDKIAISVLDIMTKTRYDLNSTTYFQAASLYKLPLAVYYYDEINDKKISLDDKIVVTKDMYDKSMYVSSKYSQGTTLRLGELLKILIRDSDNAAGNILYYNLGGWEEYKKLTAQYTDKKLDEKFYNKENLIDTDYVMDVLIRVYNNKDKYKDLIDSMEEANKKSYLNLNKYMNGKIAQKYGVLDGSINSAGISFDGYPYLIVVLSKDLKNGEHVIGDLSEIIYKSLNNE